MYIRELELFGYRNIKHKKLQVDTNVIIIAGPNGIGKTNILEAISTLMPGRNMRAEPPRSIIPWDNTLHGWCVKALVDSPFDTVRIEAIFNAETDKRIFTANGKKAASNEISSISKIIWLTPQMESLFIGPISERRKFLDRAVYLQDPTHAQNIINYRHYLKERLTLLKSANYNKTWLDILEKKVSDLAIIITSNRLLVVQMIQTHLSELDQYFPKITINIKTPVDNKTDLERFIKSKLESNRKIDGLVGKTHFDPERTDILVYSCNFPINARSTGEQKIALTAIIFALSYMTQHNSVLLLDEVFIHLDKPHREKILMCINNLKSQTWITTTDPEQIQNLNRSSLIRME